MEVDVNRYQQSCILPPGTVTKNDSTPYRVFTAFKKKWLTTLKAEDYICLPKPRKRPLSSNIKSTDLAIFLEHYPATYDVQQWPAGDVVAQRRLRYFIKKKIIDYAKLRDLPAQAGTSSISPYLTAGVLSVRQCLSVAKALPKKIGVETWINELIWRDFYQHILFFFPRVGRNRAFKLETEKIGWSENKEHFQAWCNGKTGIPIIDAAMRQLLNTGWMHNRLRMVVAMFFTKNLFLDWRLGEHYFMTHLIDGDLAANNGGWQWSVSTGTDAAPYFRIFNPYRQSERFDPNEDFIRKYCPELVSLNNKQIHRPPVLDNYPQAIVNVETTRKQAIENFKNALKSPR